MATFEEQLVEHRMYLMRFAREDRALGLSDQLALRLHLLACKTCPQFENQILTMRLAMSRWRHYGGETDMPPPSQGDTL